MARVVAVMQLEREGGGGRAAADGRRGDVEGHLGVGRLAPAGSWFLRLSAFAAPNPAIDVGVTLDSVPPATITVASPY